VDAFQYFFGKSAQAAAKSEKKNEPAEKKATDAFDYLFGKKSKEAAPAEPAKDSAKPPVS